MPLYEYECDSCRHRFEVIQKFSDLAVDVCPSCGKAVHKLFSSPAIQFKGGGWYVDDYAKKKSAPDSGSSSGEQKSSGEHKQDDKSSPSSDSSSSGPAEKAEKVPAGSSSKDS